MNIGALIPCKKGSKGVPDKNFKKMCGKPMWEWTLEAAQQSRIFSVILVSSNGGLGKHGMIDGVLYNDREYIPNIDNSSLDKLMEFYANVFVGIDVWCLLQPTSVLRSWQDIRGAHLMFSEGYDSVVSVTSVGDKYWLLGTEGFTPLYNPKDRLLRQDIRTNKLYYENGAIYFTKRRVLLEGSRIGGLIGLYEMPQERSHQVDSTTDWKICEATLAEN